MPPKSRASTRKRNAPKSFTPPGTPAQQKKSKQATEEDVREIPAKSPSVYESREGQVRLTSGGGMFQIATQFWVRECIGGKKYSKRAILISARGDNSILPIGRLLLDFIKYYYHYYYY